MATSNDRQFTNEFVEFDTQFSLQGENKSV